MQKLELTWVGKDEPIAVEPRILIEDAAKSLDDCGVMHFAKNTVINSEIGVALKSVPSKKGDKGASFPAIQMLIKPKKGCYVLVMQSACWCKEVA